VDGGLQRDVGGAAVRRLGRAEARAFLALLAVALERRRPVDLLEAVALAQGRGRVARAAARAARALRDAEPLSLALAGWIPEPARAALAAGEASGQPTLGIERARAVVERATLASRRVLVPVAYPACVVALAGLSAALLGVVAAPPIQSLRVELALLAGRPAPGGLLAAAAAHPSLAAAAGGALALAPLVLPLLVAFAARAGFGSRLLLRLPVVGAALRWRAAADFAETLGDLLGGGVGHAAAWRGAAAAVSPRAPREALQALQGDAEAGEPLHLLLERAGLPSALQTALRPERLVLDGGAAALREAGARAADAHARLLAVAGRVLATATGLVAVLLTAAIVHAVLAPLLGAGSA
jgi:general secretion pathway protein F